MHVIQPHHQELKLIERKMAPLRIEARVTIPDAHPEVDAIITDGSDW